MFSRAEGHYCRSNTQRQFLQPGLNLKIMYKLYLEFIEDKQAQPLSEYYHRKIFKKCKLSFFKQKKDMCDHCIRYSRIPKDKLTLQEIKNHKRHLKNKKIPRKLMMQDIETSNLNQKINVACFDLQKVLTTPKCQNSSMYYMRKLAIFNFTIYDLGKKQGFCYVWNESTGNRGADEISSCVYNYIQKKITEGITEFRFYSDSCGGQNRNKIIFGMFSKIAAELGVKITHIFFEPGHSQNAGDSMHAMIEKKSRGQDIFTQDQWCEIIKNAVKKKPYEVKELNGYDILNFSLIAEKRKWKNLQISKVREFCVLPRSDAVYYSKKYEKVLKTVDLRFPRLENTYNAFEILQPKYTGRLKLSEEKKNDLKKMCELLYVPIECHYFYEYILNIEVNIILEN